MSQELTTRQGDLTEQMEWARAASMANILPDAYRGKPADVMIAANLGASMGLSPAESMYRIAVIQGKPTASAELVAAYVRKAGHRLRVTGDDTSATATIIRSDDPEFEFKEVWDMKRAEKMGLASNPNWKKQPGTMLKWRAITAVARLACPEALYGVAYTPDEMYDSAPESAPRRSATDLEAEAVTVDAEPLTDDAPTEPITPEQVAACDDLDQLRAWHGKASAEVKAVIAERAAELKAGDGA